LEIREIDRDQLGMGRIRDSFHPQTKTAQDSPITTITVTTSEINPVGQERVNPTRDNILPPLKTTETTQSHQLMVL